MGLIRKLREKGLAESFRIALKKIVHPKVLRFRHRYAPVFANPSPDQLVEIENQLASLGILVSDLSLNAQAFEAFNVDLVFPPDYHGGPEGGVWTEKLLEHFIAHELCGLAEFEPGDRYIDVAGSTSPWARMLRERSIEAWNVDLSPGPQFEHLDYYLETDATAMPFEAGSIRACSLQCAFEMFAGDSDCRLLEECARVLQPGGVVVISPLYMHVSHCGYSSPEYYGKGHADPGALEFINWDAQGVLFSRKYSARLLKERILEPARKLGFEVSLLRLANKEEFGAEVYCHFVLFLQKMNGSGANVAQDRADIELPVKESVS